MLHTQCEENKVINTGHVISTRQDTLKTGFNLFFSSTGSASLLCGQGSPHKNKELLRKDVTPISGAHQTKYLEVNLDHTLKFLFDCILGARIDHFTFQRC